MGVSTPHRYPVCLSDDQRQRLETLARHGHAPVRKVRHAQVLLLSDRRRPSGRLSRTQIAGVLGMHVNSVDRIRKLFHQEGEAPALEPRPRSVPPTPPKIDGRAEAHLIAICCSKPPAGRTRWTLSLLAEEMVGRRIVTHVCAETVRKTLKKTGCNPGGRSAGASPNATRRGSWRRWKTCSTSTPPRTPLMSL